MILLTMRSAIYSRVKKLEMLEYIRRKVHHDGLDEINLPLHSVFFLPGTFLFLYGSPFETTLHDDAYGAFMTPPLYTCTREDDEYMILENTVRYFSLQVVKR